MRTSVAPLCLVFVSACAHVQETHTRQILSEESVRLAETPRPDLSRAVVRGTLSGRELRLSVSAEARCIVEFGDRVTARERVRRVPSATTLAGEAVLAGVGLSAGAALRRSSPDDEVKGRDVVGVIALAAGLGAAVALGIDASRHSDRQTVATTTVPDGEARVAPCRGRGARPTRVELATPGGRRFVARLDGFGRGRLSLPDDVWSDDQVDFDVWVDGVLVRRLLLTRSP